MGINFVFLKRGSVNFRIPDY